MLPRPQCHGEGLGPALALARVVVAIFRGAAPVSAQSGVTSAVFERAPLLVRLLFTRLSACWPMWASIAISACSADVRAAPQRGTFASLLPTPLPR